MIHKFTNILFYLIFLFWKTEVLPEDCKTWPSRDLNVTCCHNPLEGIIIIVNIIDNPWKNSQWWDKIST